MHAGREVLRVVISFFFFWSCTSGNSTATDKKHMAHHFKSSGIKRTSAYGTVCSVDLASTPGQSLHHTDGLWWASCGRDVLSGATGDAHCNDRAHLCAVVKGGGETTAQRMCIATTGHICLRSSKEDI